MLADNLVGRYRSWAQPEIMLRVSSGSEYGAKKSSPEKGYERSAGRIRTQAEMSR